MPKKDKTDKMFEESSEDKLGQRNSKDDTVEDVLSDINSKREDFYSSEKSSEENHPSDKDTN
ncbi:hypothetical protein ACFOU0_10470 [Salinicoccus sesuvii]|uniref:DUF4025 domain-containing protein n=1 Tax=Salinicoccus sesuvii TaxID=868281 RepID=A0ABV7N802_9STAP